MHYLGNTSFFVENQNHPIPTASIPTAVEQSCIQVPTTKGITQHQKSVKNSTSMAKPPQFNTFAMQQDIFHHYLNIFVKIKGNFYLLSKGESFFLNRRTKIKPRNNITT